VIATQIDAFMVFITYASGTALPRPLCLQRLKRFILAGDRPAITPCNRYLRTPADP
jgi:hypothetical protein